MSDPTYPLFPVFAFLGTILVLIPLPWHFEAWNSATCYYMIWVALSCLNQFVNSIVWAGNALNPAPIWCDISTRIIIGASVAIPAASLCIVRRLHAIAKVQAVVITRSEKRRAILIDSLICVLFPVLVIVLSYIVQGHRFNIIEDIGCSPAIYNTLLAYFIMSWWPLVLGLISAVYCTLTLLEFSKRRAQFSQLFASNKTSLSLGRYFRLMALAMTELVLTVPLSTWSIYTNLTAEPLGPWVSWADTHFAFSRMEQIPALIWRQNHQFVVAQELARWLSPACAFIFFAYFGFADEARRHYKLAFWFVARRCGFSPSTTGATATSPFSGKLNSPILPAYAPPPPPPRTQFGSSISTLCVPSDKPTYDSKYSTATLITQVADDLSPPPPFPESPMSTAPSFGTTGAYSVTLTEIESLFGSRRPSFLSTESGHSVPSSLTPETTLRPPSAYYAL